MKRELPVTQRNQILPFQNPSFGYTDFEGFFAAFLRLHPEIAISRGEVALTGKVTNAWHYETSGDSQKGIDLRAEVQVSHPDGTSRQETWVFQCKHRAKWTDTQTREAIKLANKKFPQAHFHFLLVTCELGAKAVDEGRAHPGWQLWSGKTITSKLQALPNQDEAARLVSTYFGPHWAVEILGLLGSGPFQAVGAFFFRQMEAKSFHHHRAEVIGRENELKSLHAFLRSRDHRVLILPGAGGSGKSRLLRAFAQSLTPAQKRKYTVRFLEDIGTPPTVADIEAIDGTPVIVVDDAHRQSLEPLLRFLPRSDQPKIILATRPQGIAIVRSSAAGAGVDARRIAELPPLRMLTDDETKRVVKSLLSPAHQSLALQIVNQAQGCMLIAVVACEMIRQGKLTKSHLASHQDFEQAVFLRLINEDVARLGLITDRERVDRLLAYIALTGPVPRKGPWFELLCRWTDLTAMSHQANQWLEKLAQGGLLTEKPEGYRITPDLLSDYLLYKATHDGSHRDTRLVADFLALVPENARDEAVARCLPNLAEAEWRARCESKGRHESVIEPLMQDWISQFRAASFQRRRELLEHWSRFGLYLPEQTLGIAKLAKELTTSTTPNEGGIYGQSGDGYAQVIGGAIPLVKEVARNHLHHLPDCFDLLWSIGCQESEQRRPNHQGNPIAAIIEIAQLEYRKPVAVNEAVLTWIEQQFKKPEVITKLQEPVWWFGALLAPFLKPCVEDQHYHAGTYTVRHIPIVGTQRARALRDRVITLVSSLADQGEEGIALNAIKVLGDGVGIFRMPGLDEKNSLQKKWIPLRRSALTCLASVARRYRSGFIHWAIWGELWWHVCYEPAELLRAECWEVFESLPDTFELRLVRATCSSGNSERTHFHHKNEPSKNEDPSGELSAKLWKQLCTRVAGELVTHYDNAEKLHAFLADFVKRGLKLGYHPQLSTVLTSIATRVPDLAEALVHELMASARIELQHAFGSLVDSLSPVGKPVRLDLVEIAAKSSSEILQIEASRVLLLWQNQSRLTEQGRILLSGLVRTSGPALLRSVLQEASILSAENDAFVLQLLENILENSTPESITENLLSLLYRVERTQASNRPNNLVASTLERLVPIPRIDQPMEQYYLNHLAETYPREVFAFWRQRTEYDRKQTKPKTPDGLCYQALPSDGARVSLQSFAAQNEYAVEFTILRDELMAEMQRQSAVADTPRVSAGRDDCRKLRQLARWMIEDSGSRYKELVLDWIPLLATVDDLRLFFEVVVDRSPALVLEHPEILEKLLNHIDRRLPPQLDPVRADLQFSASRWVGASRDSQWRKMGDPTPMEEAEPWHIIPRVERLISDHVHQPLLKHFYEELLNKCQAMLAFQRGPDYTGYTHPKNSDTNSN